jgi:ribose/xylose/arabinose/galactoside ABC-type transport system permease subunit
VLPSIAVSSAPPPAPCIRQTSGALFLVLLQTMLNTFGVSAGLRLLLTGVIIVAVIAAAGG